MKVHLMFMYEGDPVVEPLIEIDSDKPQEAVQTVYKRLAELKQKEALDASHKG